MLYIAVLFVEDSVLDADAFGFKYALINSIDRIRSRAFLCFI